MLRAINDLDIPIITEWIAKDPDHSAKGMTADFFRQPDTISFAIDDDQGPIMYVRLDPLDADIVRLHIQFNETERRRTALALMRYFPEVRSRIADAKAKYIVFDSESARLVSFCMERFGFVHSPDSNLYFLDISRQE